MALLKKPIPKIWLVLIASLLVGLLAAWVARSYLNTRIKEIDKKDPTKNQISVVVANRDLAKGEVLNEKTLAVRGLPEDYVQSGAVRPNEFGKVDGLKLEYPIRRGEMLMWSQIESRRNKAFSARIAEGRRAVTVPVDEINSISGLLEPGDMIDLFLTMDHEGRSFTVPILQKVAVMATGQRLDESKKTTGANARFQTVTLDTTPEEAENLIVARNAGKITAVLRNPNDTGVLPKTAKDVYGVTPLPHINKPTQAAAQPAAQPPGVTVLYGGRRLPSFVPDLPSANTSPGTEAHSSAGTPGPALTGTNVLNHAQR